MFVPPPRSVVFCTVGTAQIIVTVQSAECHSITVVEAIGTVAMVTTDGQPVAIHLTAYNKMIVFCDPATAHHIHHLYSQSVIVPTRQEM